MYYNVGPSKIQNNLFFFLQKVNSRGPKVNLGYISQMAILVEFFFTALCLEPIEMGGGYVPSDSPNSFVSQK